MLDDGYPLDVRWKFRGIGRGLATVVDARMTGE
jgi:hypothetical protein